MNLKLFILSLWLVLIGSSIFAAPIRITGTVYNNGSPVGSGEWVNIKVPGNDTATVTDSLGMIDCTVNPNTSQGILLVYFYDCKRDSISQSFSFNSLTRQLNVNLNGCPPSFNCKGSITNSFQSSGNIKIYFSLDQFRTVVDSVLADSLGFYFKNIKTNVSSGVVSARISTCTSSINEDSTVFSSSDTVSINLDYCPTPPNSHFGSVSIRSLPLSANQAFILRYRYNVQLQNFVFVDTLTLSATGQYNFPKDSSDYLLKVMPKGKQGFAATYFPNGTKWDENNTWAIGVNSKSPLNFNLNPLLNQRDSGSISGKVLVDSSILSPGFSASGIHLLDTLGRVIDFQYADIKGAFKFQKLPYGAYQVWIDQCGIPTQSETIFITSARPSYSNLIITANEEGIGGNEFVGHQEIKSVNPIKIFPNPVSHILNVESQTPLLISVYNLQGSLMWSFQEASEQIEIDVADWKPGFYMVSVADKNGEYRKKFIKQ